MKQHNKDNDLQAIWPGAAKVSQWSAFQDCFQRFIDAEGLGNKQKTHRTHVMHLLNFVAEKYEGGLSIGALRVYFGHLQDKSSCYYCSPERVALEVQKRKKAFRLSCKVGDVSLAKQKTAIKRFLEYWDRDLQAEFLKKTWAKQLHPLRKKMFKPRLTERQFEEFLKQRVVDELFLADGTFIPARKTALWLQYQFALPFAELAALKSTDIDLENRFIYIHRQKTRARFSIPIFTEKQAIRLRKWLELRQKVLKEFNTDFPELLFAYKRSGQRFSLYRWTYHIYYRFVRKIFKGTKFDQKGINSHEIRRWGASQLLHDKGWNIRDVQRLLGHTSPAVTAAYCISDIEDWRARITENGNGNSNNANHH